MFTAVCQILPVLIIVKSKSPSPSFSRHLGARTRHSELTGLSSILTILTPRAPTGLCKYMILCLLSSEPSLPLCTGGIPLQLCNSRPVKRNMSPACKYPAQLPSPPSQLSAKIWTFLPWQTVFDMWNNHVTVSIFIEIQESIFLCADWLVDLWSSQMDWKYTGKCPECHAQCGPRDRSVTMLWQLWCGQPPSVAGWGHVDWINN